MSWGSAAGGETFRACTLRTAWLAFSVCSRAYDGVADRARITRVTPATARMVAAAADLVRIGPSQKPQRKGANW